MNYRVLIYFLLWSFFPAKSLFSAEEGLYSFLASPAGIEDSSSGEESSSPHSNTSPSPEDDSSSEEDDLLEEASLEVPEKGRRDKRELPRTPSNKIVYTVDADGNPKAKGSALKIPPPRQTSSPSSSGELILSERSDREIYTITPTTIKKSSPMPLRKKSQTPREEMLNKLEGCRDKSFAEQIAIFYYLLNRYPEEKEFISDIWNSKTSKTTLQNFSLQLANPAHSETGIILYLNKAQLLLSMYNTLYSILEKQKNRRTAKYTPHDSEIERLVTLASEYIEMGGSPNDTATQDTLFSILAKTDSAYILTYGCMHWMRQIDCEWSKKGTSPLPVLLAEKKAYNCLQRIIPYFVKKLEMQADSLVNEGEQTPLIALVAIPPSDQESSHREKMLCQTLCSLGADPLRQDKSCRSALYYALEQYLQQASLRIGNKQSFLKGRACILLEYVLFTKGIADSKEVNKVKNIKIAGIGVKAKTIGELYGIFNKRCNLKDILPDSFIKYGIPVTALTPRTARANADNDEKDMWRIISHELRTCHDILEGKRGLHELVLALSRLEEYKAVNETLKEIDEKLDDEMRRDVEKIEGDYELPLLLHALKVLPSSGNNYFGVILQYLPEESLKDVKDNIYEQSIFHYLAFYGDNLALEFLNPYTAGLEEGDKAKLIESVDIGKNNVLHSIITAMNMRDHENGAQEFLYTLAAHVSLISPQLINQENRDGFTPLMIVEKMKEEKKYRNLFELFQNRTRNTTKEGELNEERFTFVRPRSSKSDETLQKKVHFSWRLSSEPMGARKLT